jgi:UDP:flavonoid glycosyltransferase YjiC (YdhE family)
MVTMGGFEELVRDRGLDHLVIAQSPQAIAKTAEGSGWIKKRDKPAGFVRGLLRLANTLIEEGMMTYWNACRDVEALIVSPFGLLLGSHIAERLNVPMIQAQLAPPVVLTRYNWDGNTDIRAALRGSCAACLDTIFRLLSWSQLRRSTNAARQKVLALPPLPRSEPIHALFRKRTPLIGAYSPAVAPRLPDWGDWIHVTGYWFLDDLPGWVPPDDLIDFLSSGPRPLFIGFGSTPFPQPETTTDVIVRAVARAGHRAVLVSGGSGLATGRLSDEVFSLDSVPHSWLLPQVCAAVHHGGAGVTGAVLRAGLPSVVVPIFADQPFWGSRLFELGVGPRPIPAQRLNENDLTSAIHATADCEMRGRAAVLGRRIREEDGVARAVEVIHNHLVRDTLPVMRHQHAH